MTDTTEMTGEQFAQCLEALNWKQVDFARRTGTTPDTVNRWIHGRLAVPAWAAAHLRLLLAADQFHRAQVAPLKARKAGDQDAANLEAADEARQTTIRLKARDSNPLGMVNIVHANGMLRVVMSDADGVVSFGADVTPTTARELAAALLEHAELAEGKKAQEGR